MTAGINKKFPCRENSVAITKLERARTDRSGETAIGGSMTTAINKHLDEIEKWFDDPAADIANITDVIPPLIAALRRAVEGLHGYQCDINSFPLNIESRGRHMDYCDKCKALSDIAEKLGSGT
jgi:hypothetical protein